MRKESIKRKELIILIAFVIGFILVLSVAVLYFRGHEPEKKANNNGKEPTFVEGKIADRDNTSEQENTEDSQRMDTGAFFLKPSAGEVLNAMRDADPYSEPQLIEESIAMKVMWPGYFFALSQSDTGETVVQLDVDESGFGVSLMCTVNITDYPEIQDLAPGQKIWVAGEVTEIDLEGTGTVFINVEFIRFDEEGPAAAKKDQTDHG